MIEILYMKNILYTKDKDDVISYILNKGVSDNIMIKRIIKASEDLVAFDKSPKPLTINEAIICLVTIAVYYNNWDEIEEYACMIKQIVIKSPVSIKDVLSGIPIIIPIAVHLNISFQELSAVLIDVTSRGFSILNCRDILIRGETNMKSIAKFSIMILQMVFLDYMTKMVMKFIMNHRQDIGKKKV
jgi:hypothetical protein